MAIEIQYIGKRYLALKELTQNFLVYELIIMVLYVVFLTIHNSKR